MGADKFINFETLAGLGFGGALGAATFGTLGGLRAYRKAKKEKRKDILEAAMRGFINSNLLGMMAGGASGALIGYGLKNTFGSLPIDGTSGRASTMGVSGAAIGQGSGAILGALGGAALGYLYGKKNKRNDPRSRITDIGSGAVMGGLLGISSGALSGAAVGTGLGYLLK